MTSSLVNRDVFLRDPAQNSLQNDGVSKVDATNTLEYELETFVCEGEYERGLDTILTVYDSHLDLPTQPSVWVSGFYGSGKSHLVKILQAVWQNEPTPSGRRPRDIVTLTDTIDELLFTLSRNAERAGGLWSASGMLAEYGDLSVRMLILSIVHRAAGLSSNYGRAKFRLWLRGHGWEQPLIAMLRERGLDPENELDHYLVSFDVVEAVTALAHAEHRDPNVLLDRWERQFDRADVSYDDMIADLREVLLQQSTDGESIPLTLLVLDEVQQYIGQSGDRAEAVQKAVELIQSSFNSRVLVVATGQAALNSTPNLQKLEGRFTTRVMLGDKDVERVVQQVVLRKRTDRVADVRQVVERVEGEIDRQLASTKIGPRSDDKENLIPDYPLLPARGRFWASVLHAIDPTGTTAQLRSQLRIVHSATLYSANKPLGHVIPADFIYDQLQDSLRQAGRLPRDIFELIAAQDDGTEDGKLRQRLIQLIFLIEQLHTEDLSDTGVRATPEILADLLCENLLAGSDDLRRQIPVLLRGLEEDGKLIRTEYGGTYAYAIQTGESLKWTQAFQQARQELEANSGAVGDLRSRTIETLLRETTAMLTKTQGQSKTGRSFDLRFGTETPATSASSVLILVRDGWSASEGSVVDDARSFGEESPVIHLFVPQRTMQDIQSALVTYLAASRVLDVKAASRDHEEGRKAASAITVRMHESERRYKQLLAEVVADTQVYQGGGSLVDGPTLQDRLQTAVNHSLQRLFPRFGMADHADWPKVLTRAQQGSPDALKAIGHPGDADQHLVIREIRKAIPGSGGISWFDLRKRFGNAPYGWPQDAIDGAIAVMVGVGMVNATRNNQPLQAKDLNKQQASATMLIGEDEVVSKGEMLIARGPFQTLYGAQPSEDEVRSGARKLVADLNALARKAGGEPPAPVVVPPTYLREMEFQTGNALVKALAMNRQAIDADIAAWREREKRIAERLPAWKEALALATYASALPNSADLRKQLNAVRDQRMLLHNPDPVQPIARDLGNLLREALASRIDRYTTALEDGIIALRASDEWVRLTPAQRDDVLKWNKLVTPVPPPIGSERELLAALATETPAQWDEKVNALPTHFDRAHAEIARLLEPTVQEVSLEKPIFRKPIDVDTWLLKTRDALLEHVNNGFPVRIK